MFECHMPRFPVTQSQYETSSLPLSPSDPMHMCLEYRNSSLSYKQMCVCVKTRICAHVCPENLCYCKRCYKARAPFMARIYNLSNKWDAFMWPGPASQAEQSSFPLE